MPSMDPEPLPRRRGRGELLDQIYVEGARRRRRRRNGSVGLTAAALAVVAGTLFAAGLNGSTPQHVATRGQTAPTSPGSSTSLPSFPTPSTTTPEVATTSTLAGPVPTTAPGTTPRPATTATATGPTTTAVSGGSGTLPPTSSTTEPPTTMAPPTCRNSTDQACGPFRWDPEPGPNAPLTIDVTSAARAGAARTFDFTIVYADADAPVIDGCRSIDFGDGQSSFTGSSPGCPVASCIARYGPWTPPTPQPGRVEGTVSHAFAQPGTYEVRLMAVSRQFLCGDPYENWADKTVTVTVP